MVTGEASFFPSPLRERARVRVAAALFAPHPNPLPLSGEREQDSRRFEAQFRYNLPQNEQEVVSLKPYNEPARDRLNARWCGRLRKEAQAKRRFQMRHRFLASVGILAALIVVGSLALVPVGAQSPTTSAKTTAAAKKWTPLRTAWGEPDLQGIWSYATLTPLERPGGPGGKEVLSEEEVAALDEDARKGADRRDGGPEADLARAYNAFWYDRGKSDGRTSLIVDPPDGRLPPLTPEGQKRQAARAEQLRAHPFDSWEDRPLQERCITYHGVPPLPTGYNNTYQIFQTPGSVVILDENIHDVRTIPLDGRPHVGQSLRQWNGNSRGRWDDNTLVVETTNYSPKTIFRFPGAGETLHAVERFTRVAADKIDYRFTIEDPTTYTRPWTVALPMTNLPDYVIYEYACHEGNYALAHVLSSTRAQEKAAAAAAKKD